MVFRYFILESEELSLFLHSFLWYTGWDNIFEKYLHDRNKLIGTGGPSIRHDEYTFQWQMHDISCYILFIKLYEEHEISVMLYFVDREMYREIHLLIMLLICSSWKERQYAESCFASFVQEMACLSGETFWMPELLERYRCIHIF